MSSIGICLAWIELIFLFGRYPFLSGEILPWSMIINFSFNSGSYKTKMTKMIKTYRDVYVVTTSIIYSMIKKVKILRKILDHVLLHHQEDCQGGLRLHHPHRRLHLRLLHHPLQQRDRVLRWPLQIFPQGFYLCQRIHVKIKNGCFLVLIPMNSGVCDDSWRVWIWRAVDKLASRGRQVQALLNLYDFSLFFLHSSSSPSKH